MNVATAPSLPAIRLKYSPVNQAYFVLWHDQVLRVFPAASGRVLDRERARNEATQYMHGMRGVQHAHTHEENPLSEGATVGLAAIAAIGLGVVIYFATRPAAAASPAPAPNPAPTPIPIPSTGYTFAAGRKYQATLMAPLATVLPDPSTVTAQVQANPISANFANLSIVQPLANEYVMTADCLVSFSLPSTSIPAGWSVTFVDQGPSAAPVPIPVPAGQTWTPILAGTTFAPGKTYRVSYPAAAVSSAQTWSNGVLALATTFGLPIVPQVWTDGLNPSDWPLGDTNPFRAQFTFPPSGAPGMSFGPFLIPGAKAYVAS